MLRRALTLALIGAVVAIGVPTTILAQDQLSVGAISGRAIDAAGRGVGARRVELMRGTQIVSVTDTNASGEWSFRDVKPGEYVVRVNINGKISGIRVSIIGGQLVSNTLIVVSTASISPQIGAAAGALGNLLTTLAPSVVTTVVTAAAAAGYETETTELNDEILEDILQEMTPAERVAFATAVLEAIEESQGSLSPFAQFVPQFEAIVVTQGATVPDFPPPTSVS